MIITKAHYQAFVEAHKYATKYKDDSNRNEDRMNNKHFRVGFYEGLKYRTLESSTN